MKRLVPLVRFILVTSLMLGSAWHFDLIGIGVTHSIVRAGTSVDCDTPPGLVTNIDTSAPVLTDERPSNAPGAGPDGGILMGLATARYGFDLGVRTMQIRSADISCVRIDRITVSAGQIPEIWINPALTEGTCKYEKTLEHEHQHIRNYEDHLAAFERRLKTRLLDLMAGATSLAVRESDDVTRARSELKDAALTAVEAIHEISAEVAARKNAIMDTPSEYHRISRLCP